MDFLSRLTGYEERSDGRFERFELPSPRIVLILGLGPPVEVDGLETTCGCWPGSFLAGLQEVPVRTCHSGFQQGIQVDLKPTTARRLWGGVGAELTGRFLSLRDVPGDRFQAERLEALHPRGRIAHVQSWIERLLSRNPPVDHRIVWAESRILEARGRLRIRGLSKALHMGERSFTRHFEAGVGMTPKRYARITRFEHIQSLLSQGPGLSLADIAQEAGCFDQAHLVREVRQFAHSTPGALRADSGQPLER